MPAPFDTSKDEQHPAFGTVRVGRIHASPGAVLFQSDLRHSEYIEVTVTEAVRNRELKRDWIHPTRILCRFSMSLAQWASFVSSAGTEGVPVTVKYADGKTRPELPYEPRLSVSRAEAHNAAHDAFTGIQSALAAYEAVLADKSTAATRRTALANLRASVANATSNVDYAAKSFADHAEDVVERSRADIEAMVIAMAAQHGLTADQLADQELPALAAPQSTEEPEDAQS